MNIKIPKHLLAEVDRRCQQEERSRSWMLRQLVTLGLGVEKRNEA